MASDRQDEGTVTIRLTADDASYLWAACTAMAQAIRRRDEFSPEAERYAALGQVMVLANVARLSRAWMAPGSEQGQ